MDSVYHQTLTSSSVLFSSASITLTSLLLLAFFLRYSVVFFSQISPEGVFQTSAEKIVNHNPSKANFNPKAYDCMASLPGYSKLIRSQDIDKVGAEIGHWQLRNPHQIMDEERRFVFN